MQPDSSYFIRSATEVDIPEMYLISAHAHLAGYEHLIPHSGRADFDRHYAINAKNSARYINTMRSRIRDPRWHIWVAERDGHVVGYTLAHKPDDEHLFKKGLFVSPKLQGHGIGAALLRASLQIIEHGIIELVVIEANHRARRLYEKNGFVIVGPSEKSFFGARQVVMRIHRP